MLPYFCIDIDLIKVKSRISFDFTGNIHAYITVFLHLYYMAAVLKTHFYKSLVSICLHFPIVLFTTILSKPFLSDYLPSFKM